MHGEVRTPVSQAQRLVVMRGSEVQTGSLASDSSVTAVVEYFHNAAGEKDQQRIRLMWPLRRGGFPDEQPSVA